MDDKPWFIRLGANLRPYSAPGWILTAIYVLGVIGLAFFARHRQHQADGWVLYAILMVTWTIAYLVLAYRNSEGGEVLLDRDRRRGK